VTNLVKIFRSSDAGAGGVDNTAGSLISSVLDRCLVDGYGQVTLDSLVVTGNVATCTKNPHGFTAVIDPTYSAKQVHPVIRIEGATGAAAGLNGDWRITIVDATTFTFATTGISDQTATGTITALRAPAGYTKTWVGTNTAAYHSDDPFAFDYQFRIDDTATTYSRIRGNSGFADQAAFGADAGTLPFPTNTQLSGGGYIYKATGSNRSWVLISDGRAIYFFCDPAGNAEWNGGFAFGDLDAYAAGDAHACFCVSTSSSGGTFFLYALGSASAAVIAKNYDQSILSAALNKYSHSATTGIGYNTQAHPAPADQSLHLWPVEAWDGAVNARGLMPGLWNPIHNSTLGHGVVEDYVPQLPGRIFVVQKVSSWRVAIDAIGPWRAG
jgi:hypothetical protein